MRTLEEIVAEFNLKADKAVYEKGEKLYYERIMKAFPKRSFTEYCDIQEEFARRAYEDDGYTELGFLTYEEIYFLLVEHYSLDDANEYLDEYKFYELGELEVAA